MCAARFCFPSTATKQLFSLPNKKISIYPENQLTPLFSILYSLFPSKPPPPRLPSPPHPFPSARPTPTTAAEVKRRDRRFTETQAQMTYNDFLNALMRLAEKLYHTADTIDDAFQQLLMENVLPLASRRSPDPVNTHLEDPEVIGLFEYFDDALYSLYSFYASAADAKRRTNTKSGEFASFDVSIHSVNTSAHSTVTLTCFFFLSFDSQSSTSGQYNERMFGLQ